MAFRTYASAGALYPVEVYAATGPSVEGVEPGLYHFDPARLGLVRLRAGDHRGFLVRAAAGEELLARSPLVLALTGIPWRTGWKYGERAYRHLFWDAGMILANLLAAAEGSGWPARVVLGFDDREVEALLGVDGEDEFPLCLVGVGAGSPVEPAAGNLEPLEVRTRSLSAREERFPVMSEANRAGVLRGGEAVRAWRALGRDLSEGPGPALGSTPSSRREEPNSGRSEGPPPVEVPSDAPRDDLETVIRRRGSARSFRRLPLPAGPVRTVFALALRGVPADLAPGGSRLIEPFAIVSAVEGVVPGAYAWRGGELRLLRAGSFRREARYLCLEQRLAADAAVTAFLMARLEEGLDRLGDRGYRVAQLEGGIVAGRMYPAASAHRIGASGLTFYDDEVAKFFSPDADSRDCMLVVAMGDSPRLARDRS